MISVTALPSYLYCQRKLFLNNVLGLREPVNAALVRGIIRHKAHEEIDKKEERIIKQIEELDFDKISNLYKQEHHNLLKEIIIKNRNLIGQVDLTSGIIFNEALPFILEESRSRAERIFSLIEKENVFGDELWLRVTPKIKSEFRIESKIIGVKGVIDRIEVHQDTLVPVELKTGKAPSQGVWDSHRVQVAAYCMLLEEYFNMTVKEGVVSYLDTRQDRTVVMNPFLKSDIAELVANVKSLLASQEIPSFTKNENKCKSCGLREFCFDEKFLKKRANEIFTSAQ